MRSHVNIEGLGATPAAVFNKADLVLHPQYGVPSYPAPPAPGEGQQAGPAFPGSKKHGLFGFSTFTVVAAGVGAAALVGVVVVMKKKRKKARR